MHYTMAVGLDVLKCPLREAWCCRPAGGASRLQRRGARAMRALRQPHKTSRTHPRCSYHSGIHSVVSQFPGKRGLAFGLREKVMDLGQSAVPAPLGLRIRTRKSMAGRRRHRGEHRAKLEGFSAACWCCCAAGGDFGGGCGVGCVIRGVKTGAVGPLVQPACQLAPMEHLAGLYRWAIGERGRLDRRTAHDPPGRAGII